MKSIVKWGIGAGVCAAAAVCWYSFSGSDEEIVTFRKAKVVQDDFVLRVQATGTLEPEELVDVGAQVTGKILELGRVINSPAEGETYDPAKHDPAYCYTLNGQEVRGYGYLLVKEAAADAQAAEEADTLSEEETAVRELSVTELEKVLLNGRIEDAEVDADGNVWVGKQAVSLMLVNGKPVVNGNPQTGKLVDYAAEVEENQLLARIDDELVKLSVERAEASVRQAKSQLSQAKSQLMQAESDVLKADASAQQAEAGLAQAQANLRQVEANVAQAEVNKNKADRDLERAKKLGVGDALSQMDFDQYLSSAENAGASLTSAKAQIDTAKAQIQSAEAQLASAKVQQKSAQVQVESAKAQVESAEAQVVSANVQLKSEKRNEEYTLIVSPIKGTVIVRQANVGQTVVSSMSASTLFLVAKDLRKMQIWSSVNEADIAKVRSCREVRYTVDALPNESFTGTVNKVRPNATMASNVVTYIVEVDIENSVDPKTNMIKLLPYMSANANFIVKDVQGCLMVQDAVFDFMPEEKYMADGEAEKLQQAPAKRGPRPEMPAGAEHPKRPDFDDSFTPAIVWKLNSDDKLEHVRVLRGESDGTRSIVKPMPGQTLDAGTEFVTAIMVQKKDAAQGGAPEGNSPFGMKRPERRQRSAGGASPAGGAAGGGRPSGPPM